MRGREGQLAARATMSARRAIRDEEDTLSHSTTVPGSLHRARTEKSCPRSRWSLREEEGVSALPRGRKRRARGIAGSTA